MHTTLVMEITKTGLQIVRDTNLAKAVASYNNPRLLDDEQAFLDHEHREELLRESELTSWNEYADQEKIRGGVLRRAGVITRQGYEYDVLIGIPDEPSTDVMSAGTTAWFTSVKSGHYEHLVRGIVEDGRYAVFVGAEGSYDSKLSPKPTSPISLANSAATVLSVVAKSQEILCAEGHDVDQENLLLAGESRGGMTMMGVLALEAMYGKDTLLADNIAPCIPKAMSKPGDALRLMEQISKEPLELAKLLGKLGLVRLVHYPGTIDLSPRSVAHQLQIGGALFNGEAGALGRHVPKHKLLHIGLFNGDFASMPGEWQLIFSEHENVRILSGPGSHMSIVDLDTKRNMRARAHAALRAHHRGERPTPENTYNVAAEWIRKENEEIAASGFRRRLARTLGAALGRHALPTHKRYSTDVLEHAA